MLEESGQGHLVARGYLDLFSFFFERDRSTLLACLLASIQPRTSLVKFARSPCTDPPGSLELAKFDAVISYALLSSTK